MVIMLNINDVGAEQGLLGAVLDGANQEVVVPHFLAVPMEAYFDPRHQQIAATMRDMIIRGDKVDAITVCAELADAGYLSRLGNGTYLHTLLARPWSAGFAPEYAARIVELFGRRKLYYQCSTTMQHLDGDPMEGDSSLRLDAAIGAMRATLDEVLEYAATGTVHDPMSLDDLLARRQEHDWLIPGLLERGDRLVLTGEEGFGKSELVSQLALCAAGGLHPFTGDPLSTETRVLVVDCENSIDQTQRRWRRIAGAVEGVRAMHGVESVPWGKRIKVEFRTSGLDLTQGRDALWLEALVGSVSPDILVVGPLYKLHNTNINDGEAAKRILSVLDNVRERHRCVIITEAHAGKAENGAGQRKMAPEGSSLFLRWPEFGFGLRRHKDNPYQQADIVSWRGQREERAWPSGLLKRGQGLLPWGPTPEYYDLDPS